jgi:hypothetical protein
MIKKESRLETNELLLALHVRNLAMQMLSHRAPQGSSADEISAFQRDNYALMVNQVMKDLDYTAGMIAEFRSGK